MQTIRFALAALVLIAATAAAQDDPPAGRGGRGGVRGAWQGPMDTMRARQLYVSRNPGDLRGCARPNSDGNSDAECGNGEKKKVDSTWRANAAKFKYTYEKVTWKSDVDGLEIPAAIIAPLDKSKKYPALVWVHGGVHSAWSTEMFPFATEAIERGYVIVAPDYRGSTGYGDAFYRKIDYGGKEVDDVFSSYAYLKTLPYIDTTKVGLMGWSHGGFIVSHILFRGKIPFKAGAAIVPVTNLVFRLNDHAPTYARDYAPEEGIQGLPWEQNCGPKKDRACIDIYLERSPVFHAENLQVPMLVHVATNDCDVFFRENQQMVYTLMALKPKLAETKIYKDPPPGLHGCGHSFSRRVFADTSARYLQRNDSPEQIDSWNRTWAFFERSLGVRPPTKR
jgi:dipeptidyl aminopeptidase/acylaminoacyl peptidase